MVIIDSYVGLRILMNTRRYIPVNLRLTKNFFPEYTQGFFEKLDLNKIRLRAVGGSNNCTSFSEMILKTDDFTGFDDVTCKLFEIHNIYT